MKRPSFSPPLPVIFFAVLFLYGLPLEEGLSQETEHDSKVVQRETQETERAARTSKKAESKKALEDLGQVTFQEVLQRPDDLDLNFRYAKAKVAKNDLLGAAAALERILMVNPELDPVRLFYAVVLYRLDNLTEATRELETLSKRELPAALRAELKAYQKAIRLRKKKTRLALRQSVGFQFDTNRNASPSSKKRFFGGGLLDTTGSNRSEDDTSFLNITTVDLSQDLGFQAGHALLGSFTYYLQEQTEVDSLDLSSYQYELGGTLKSRFFNFTPMFYASNIILSRETFLRIQGGSLVVDRSFGSRLDVFSSMRLEHQDYVPITENLAAIERRGNQFELEEGARIGLTSAMDLLLAVGYLHKEAKHEYNAYDRFAMSFAHSWLLGKGQFLLNKLDVTFDKYREPDVALVGRERHDRALRHRVTYGLPLAVIGMNRILPALGDITATTTYEYYRSFSNVTNYTYHNNKWQAMLSKRWEF